jgi:1-phosphofructokinase
VNDVHEQPSVAVFAPSPVVTVTLEATRGGGTDVHFHAGGQGFWVARMIRSLGGSAILCAALGGEAAVVLRSLIRYEGIDLREVPAQSANGAYVHDRRGGGREFVAEQVAEPLTRHELDALYGATLVAAIGARTCVLTANLPSVVPASTYRRLTHDLRRNRVGVIVDTSRDCLAEALPGGPHLVKISDEELIRDGYAKGASTDAIVDGIRHLQRLGANDVVVSCAERPVLASMDGQLLAVECPTVDVIDHRGAGDSMTATLAVSRAAGMSSEDSLRRAVAAATLNVTRHGLATGRREDIELLAGELAVRVLGEDSPRQRAAR